MWQLKLGKSKIYIVNLYIYLKPFYFVRKLTELHPAFPNSLPEWEDGTFIVSNLHIKLCSIQKQT